MSIDAMHPEDVKAAIRKRYGSINAFVRQKGLPATGVSDLFRGRTSRPVKEAIETALSEPESIIMDDSKAQRRTHGLSAGVK